MDLLLGLLVIGCLLTGAIIGYPVGKIVGKKAAWRNADLVNRRNFKS